MSRRWLLRVAVASACGLAGWLVAVVVRFEPRPVGWTLLVVVFFSLVWLVLDTLDARPARWQVTVPGSSGTSVPEVTLDERLLSSHLAASEPDDALRERLLALARSRDPALADPLLQGLAAGPPRRLSLAEIDRILTHLEEIA